MIYGSSIRPLYLTWKVKVKVTQILVGRRAVWYTYIYLPAVYYPLIWMSQRGVWWQAGFSAVPAIFLVQIVYKFHGISTTIGGLLCVSTAGSVLTPKAGLITTVSCNHQYVTLPQNGQFLTNFRDSSIMPCHSDINFLIQFSATD